jgi:C-terminal processing protease CtpA/Prc
MLAERHTSHTCYLTRWDPDYYTLQAALLSQTLAGRGTSDPSVLEKERPGHYSSQARPHRAGIGISTQRIDGRHYVSHVLAQSPARKAGVLPGDLLLEVDGRRLEGTGVEPDIEVPFDIRFAAGRDVQFERAKDEMVKLIGASSRHGNDPE